MPDVLKKYKYGVVDIAASADWQLVDFGFTGNALVIANGATVAIQFSFDGGANVHGLLDVPALKDWPISFYGLCVDKVWIKRTLVGTGTVKVWAWC